MKNAFAIASASTKPFAGHSISYSPFYKSKFAIACAANYGLVGNGKLCEYQFDPMGNMTPLANYDTQDGLFDVAWSEIHEHQLVTGSGDGSLKLFDIKIKDFPIRGWHEHTRDVFAVDWSTVEKSQFLSASWDGTIKIWRPDIQHSIITLSGHEGCVYNASFSPHHPSLIASCSSDGSLKMWDLRNSTRPIMSVVASPTEVLSLDWNKYMPNTIATGSVDRTAKVWDLRNQPNCLRNFQGHDYAIRNVKFSPHSREILATSSYDMTAKVWNLSAPQDPLKYIHDKHSEFVVGLCWSLFDPFVLTTCSWDYQIHLTNLKGRL